MAMDWANERFVLLYTRDTVTWKLLSWEARAVLMFLFRKVDRAGVIELGADGLEGLAALIEVPVDVLERTMPQLTRAERATVTIRDGWLALPNFLDAQETPRSDRQRQRDSRETRRDVALAVERGILRPTVTVRDATVTVGHTESRTVTPTLPEPTRDEPERDPASPAPPALELALARPDAPRTPDPVARLWQTQERLRHEVIPGCRALKLTADRRKLVESARKAGYPDEDLEAALLAAADEVRRDPSQARWFNGETNWRPRSIAFRLGSVGAPPPNATGTAQQPPVFRSLRETTP